MFRSSKSQTDSGNGKVLEFWPARPGPCTSCLKRMHHYGTFERRCFQPTLTAWPATGE